MIPHKPGSAVYHLPAYVALQRWASGRTVVVVAPRDREGPARLRAAGARRVCVVGTALPAEAGIECFAAWEDLPLVPGTVELVLCIEGYPDLEAPARALLLDEVRRLLAPHGVFAAWAPHGGEDARVDFWALEEELSARWGEVFMVAELPWRGVSLAPVVDDDRVGPPRLGLDESLIAEPPQATHYLAVATSGALPPELTAALTERCLLVPLPEAADASGELVARLREEVRERSQEVAAARKQLAALGAEAASHRKTASEASARLDAVQRDLDGVRVEASKVDELERTLAAARERATRSDTDLKVITRSVKDLEEALGRANDRLETKTRELQQRGSEFAALSARTDSLVAERENLARQLEVAIAEREGARQLSTRAEAELDLTRRRLTKQEQQLDEKLEEASRLQAEAEVLRAKLDHHQAMLAQSKTREEELSQSAAENAEHGRMLTEVAIDRDRLREELGRRAQQIQQLEERLWNTREDVQKERLENVRLAGEVVRLKEQTDRSRVAEAERAKAVEQLSAELHGVERERAELLGLVRSREDDVARLRAQAEALASESDGSKALRAELEKRGRELADLGARLESARAGQAEAEALARKRGEQLSAIGEEIERLRRSAEEHAATSAGLQSELDVKSLEVEQLAASVANLQHQLETQRKTATTWDTREAEMQRELERMASDLEGLRRRLREREQELEDLVGAHESSGVEMYKLRRELEAAAHANEQLEEALGLRPGEAEPPIDHSRWPEEAVSEIKRLRAQLAAQARRHSEQLAAREAQLTATEGGSDAVRSRIRRLQLEVEIRAQEHEQALGQLDAAEQKIWEMTDASDRNAARLAAGLAQLEKHKEELDETRDELEVTRKLLAAAQARALEQERLLASERAKLARMGADLAASPDDDGIEGLFADLEVGDKRMVDLAAAKPFPKAVPEPEPGVPTPEADRTGTASSGILEVRGPRVVVEELDVDDAHADDAWAQGVTAAPGGDGDGGNVSDALKARRGRRT
jgi:chromosome segregation ATPase